MMDGKHVSMVTLVYSYEEEEWRCHDHRMGYLANSGEHLHFSEVHNSWPHIKGVGTIYAHY